MGCSLLFMLRVGTQMRKLMSTGKSRNARGTSQAKTTTRTLKRQHLFLDFLLLFVFALTFATANDTNYNGKALDALAANGNDFTDLNGIVSIHSFDNGINGSSSFCSGSHGWLFSLRQRSL